MKSKAKPKLVIREVVEQILNAVPEVTDCFEEDVIDFLFVEYPLLTAHQRTTILQRVVREVRLRESIRDDLFRYMERMGGADEEMMSRYVYNKYPVTVELSQTMAEEARMEWVKAIKTYVNMVEEYGEEKAVLKLAQHRSREGYRQQETNLLDRYLSAICMVVLGFALGLLELLTSIH